MAMLNAVKVRVKAIKVMVMSTKAIVKAIKVMVNANKVMAKAVKVMVKIFQGISRSSRSWSRFSWPPLLLQKHHVFAF